MPQARWKGCMGNTGDVGSDREDVMILILHGVEARKDLVELSLGLGGPRSKHRAILGSVSTHGTFYH